MSKDDDDDATCWGDHFSLLKTMDMPKQMRDERRDETSWLSTGFTGRVKIKFKALKSLEKKNILKGQNTHFRKDSRGFDLSYSSFPGFNKSESNKKKKSFKCTSEHNAPSRVSCRAAVSVLVLDMILLISSSYKTRSSLCSATKCCKSRAAVRCALLISRTPGKVSKNLKYVLNIFSLSRSPIWFVDLLPHKRQKLN